MQNNPINRLAAVLLTTLASLTIGHLQAVEFKPFGTSVLAIDLHGFASQGFIASSKYNYLGDSTHGSFKFSEAGLNISFHPFPRTRVAAQVFTYAVGEAGQYDVLLDYALTEYTFNDRIGIRAGRIRRPEGIYNHIQDVDLARTFVLLPQGVYDARWRDFAVSLDGAELFGTIPLKGAGSLSYELYAGTLNLSENGGVALQIRDSLPGFVHLDGISPAKVYGGQLWWNTPVNGLRLGAACGYVPVFNFTTTIQTPVGPIHPDNRTSALSQHYSAEYLWNAWTFQAEFYLTDGEPIGAGTVESHSSSWYASAAYRFNKRFELGGYYTESYRDTHDRENSLKYQKDTALSLRFDASDAWIFKVEGHYLRGTGLLQDNANNPNQQDDGWWMMAAKATFSF